MILLYYPTQILIWFLAKFFNKSSITLRTRIDAYFMRKGVMPKQGYMQNPLLKWPRNANCFCFKTKIKAKNCCLPKQAQIVPVNEGLQLQFLIKRMNLVKDPLKDRTGKRY